MVKPDKQKQTKKAWGNMCTVLVAMDPMESITDDWIKMGPFWILYTSSLLLLACFWWGLINFMPVSFQGCSEYSNLQKTRYTSDRDCGKWVSLSMAMTTPLLFLCCFICLVKSRKYPRTLRVMPVPQADPGRVALSRLCACQQGYGMTHFEQTAQV